MGAPPDTAAAPAGDHMHCTDFASIRNLRQAVLVTTDNMRKSATAGAGVYWDFNTGSARSGRTWQAKAPEHIREQLCRDCSDEELGACREMTMISQIPSAPAGSRPKVLIVIGPSGAGKSMILPRAAKTFGVDLSSFGRVDGDDMRSCHGAWRSYIADDPVNGYMDAYDIYTSNKGNKDLKKKYSKEFLKARKSVVFPWTNIEQAALDLMKENEYSIYVLGLLISCAESDCRQKNRAELNGRWAETPEKKWTVTMDHLVTMCQPSNSDMALVYDSTDVKNMRLVYSRGVPDSEAPDQLEQTIEALKADMHF